MDEIQQIRLKIQEGEGFRLEFKERLSNLDREIVAFANSAGGEIFIGVNDQGEIKGIPINNGLLSQIHDIARNCDPSIHIEIKKHKELQILVVQVDEGRNKPYKCRDGFFLRIGPNSQKLKRDEIIQFINEVGSTHFDEAINSRFKYPKDFSDETLKDYLKICQIQSPFLPEEILMSLGVLEEEKSDLLKMKNAGVLFFSKKPQDFLRESFITAVRYQTQDRFSILDKKEFKGSLISQIEDSLAFLIRHMSMAIEFDETHIATRKNVYDYPPIALREAIVNAVTHRDYLYDNAPIYIHMYPTHIDIENPGGLFRGLSVEDLGRKSVRRNRLIADLLQRAGYIERVGSGFNRMKRALEENQNPQLEVVATNFFNIRFYKRKPDFDLQILSRRQLKLYQQILERKSLSKREAALTLGVSEDTVLRELKVLISHGLIHKRGEGKTTVYCSIDG